MICPVCDVDLKMSDRQGVEVDYCPQCRGVWLDRGELDKIIQRSMTLAMPLPPEGVPAGQPAPPYNQGYNQYANPAGSYRRDDDDDDYYRQPGYNGQPQRKRKSFLGEIFDFD